MKRAVPVLLLVLAACATPATQRPAVSSQATDEEARTQLAMAFNRRMDMLDQLWRVNYRLGAAASDLCGDHVARASGVLVRVAASFEEQSRPAALARYPALGDAPTVVSIAPGSAAEAAGLARNDVITTVNGEPIATTGKPLEAYAALFRKAPDGPLRLVVQRAGETRDVTLDPQRICDYPAIIVNKPEVNAATDGKSIQVYRGMMDFVRSDDELALVLGHEMAHDLRGHLAAQRKNAAVGTVVGAVFDVLLGAATGVVGNTFSNMGGRLTATTPSPCGGAWRSIRRAPSPWQATIPRPRSASWHSRRRSRKSTPRWRRARSCCPMSRGAPPPPRRRSREPAARSRRSALDRARQQVGLVVAGLRQHLDRQRHRFLGVGAHFLEQAADGEAAQVIGEREAAVEIHLHRTFARLEVSGR